MKLEDAKLVADNCLEALKPEDALSIRVMIKPVGKDEYSVLVIHPTRKKDYLLMSSYWPSTEKNTGQVEAAIARAWVTFTGSTQGHGYNDIT